MPKNKTAKIRIFTVFIIKFNNIITFPFMNRISHLLKFIGYLIKAKGAHSIHSPFVYDLYTKVIKDDGNYYAYPIIESIRAKMLLSETSVNVTDHGTGKSGIKKARSIANQSVKRAKYGQLLFRLTNTYQPKIIIELGTSLGITTAYLASPLKESKVITMEGCNEIANLAADNFDRLKLKNIEIVIGNFNSTLPATISNLHTVDLVFFDGNHQLEPTLNYFEQLLPLAHANSIFIFDDIHWSEEMGTAWERIASHPEVSVSIDLFELGIIFFSKEKPQNQYVLRF
jgi:predicted O-methyltransferase YrrM